MNFTPSFPFLICSLFLVTAALGAGAEESVRSWTDRQGRAVQATLVEALAHSIKVKLATGAVTEIPILTLSDADQAYVKAFKDKRPAVSTGPAADAGPPPSTQWPDRVALKGIPEVTIVSEDAAKKEFIYRTEHFQFKSPVLLGASAVREFSRLFEATFEANCLLPLALKPKPETGQELFECRIYETKQEYIEKGGIAGSAGIYSGGEKRIKVPLQSLGLKYFGKKLVVDRGDDNHTLIHETTHQMMNHWLRKLPTWFVEGSADYLTMPEYDNGVFNFQSRSKLLEGYIRRRGGGESFHMPHLEKLMTIGGAEWAAALSAKGGASRNYRAAGVLTYYFYHMDDKGDGAHIIAYLRAIEGGANGIKAAAQHLLRDRTYEKLEEDVAKALHKAGFKIEWM